MSSPRRECGVRKQITAKDRALEDSHSWGGVGAETEGIQGEREQPERWGVVSYILPLFQCYPPSASPSASQELS